MRRTRRWGKAPLTVSFDFKRNKAGHVPLFVARIEYDPNRTAFIATDSSTKNGEQAYSVHHIAYRCTGEQVDFPFGQGRHQAW